MIHKLVEPDVKHSLLNTNTYALCDLLSKSLAGRTKFTVYAYLNVKKHTLCKNSQKY
jgi:hypothetical protein